MAATSNSRHLPLLTADARKEVGQQLEVTLLELIDLSLLGKQLQWSANGSLFNVLHQRLDQLVESLRELADTVAERAVAIGYWPDAQADAIAAGSSHTAVPHGPVEDQAVISLLAQCLTEVAERTRGRLDHVAELDVVSRDILIEILRELEEQLWLGRAQLPFGG